MRVLSEAQLLADEDVTHLAILIGVVGLWAERIVLAFRRRAPVGREDGGEEPRSKA
jgi:hypothetical protein